MRLGHPSARRLLRWLDGDEGGLDRHLSTCEYCAERLDEMAGEDQSLQIPLLRLLAPPEELPTRLQGGIDARLRARDDFTLISELFGLPIRAARVMSSSSMATKPTTSSTQGET